MKDQLIERIRDYMASNGMLDGGNICVGLSGGIDSVFLLRALLSIADGEISAVHVNHMLRGGESDGDERFVRELCDELKVPLRVFLYPVAQLAAIQGGGVEETGRAVRRQAYLTCARGGGSPKIALAHHANDQAETFLFNASRGTSLAGIGAMRPVQPLSGGSAGRQTEEEQEAPPVIIRPLLAVTRWEIEDWMRENGFAWRSDSTNSDDGYARNSIRMHVIPSLESGVNAQAVRHLALIAADAAAADEIIRNEAKRLAAEYVRRPGADDAVGAPAEDASSDASAETAAADAGGKMIDALAGSAPEEGAPSENTSAVSASEKAVIFIDDGITGAPALVQGCVFLDALEEIAGSRKDLGREQIRQIRALFGLQPGKRTDLPYGVKAERLEDCIKLSAAASEEEVPEIPAAVEVDPGRAGIYTWGNWTVETRVISAEGMPDMLSDIPSGMYTKWFDCDRMGQSLELRAREAGDYLVVDASGGTKKLKDYYIDEKVPRSERDEIPVRASGDEVIWVIGRRISESAKVTEETKTILEVRASDAGIY